MTLRKVLTSKSVPQIEPIGIVISGSNNLSPNIFEYSFILTDNQSVSNSKNSPFVQQGQYCLVESHEGFVVGIVEQIRMNNQYFSNVQTVKNFNLAKVNMKNFFPSDQWECHIVDVHLLGTVRCKNNLSDEIDPATFKRIQRVGFPVNPGNKVFLLKGNFLRHFLGLDENGLNIGKLSSYKLDVTLNMNRLFNKHVAILAQSGAGKSYLLSVLFEELLTRPKDLGTPAMFLVDLHGEYRFLKEKAEDSLEKLEQSKISSMKSIQNRITSFNGLFIQIGVPDLTEYDFKRYQPGISIPQLRELRKAIKNCRKKFKKSEKSADDGTLIGYDINDLITELSENPDINSKLQSTLIGWLADLNNLRIFSKKSSPSIYELIKMGELTILDLSSIISMRKKQILLHYLTSKVFYYRRSGKIPPFIIFLEEAHNFLPESGGKDAITKNIFETIAREGRKFFAQLVLVSQRPVRLSTTALSQCNTQIVMRITNPYDLNHIKQTSEALTNSSIEIISTLPTGNALIMGAALNYPIFTKIRKRELPNPRGEKSISEMCQKYLNKDVFNNSKQPITKISPIFIQENFLELDTFELKEDS
ncbi:ATP-binding protein [Promethearchaeum syntrophicum]|uniref:ATP-binding protein n=1 Tax=Promethearchaeum syntrophicum TaxID=2594042 RepID=A0A5B9D9E6_9ARCH|nr:ATP-binding protein [Candidatus Prometheoarchaeum syntrophicum]QEE15703.1 AAA-like domain protein [Candidatus Prometheoarchaeum syntrophicum]